MSMSNKHGNTTALKNVWGFTVALLLSAYLVSYLILSRHGYAEARTLEVRGFYFVIPTTPSGKRANALCNLIYYPLIRLEMLLGTGRAPASDPFDQLGTEMCLKKCSQA